jgi:hypothetical protein
MSDKSKTNKKVSSSEKVSGRDKVQDSGNKSSKPHLLSAKTTLLVGCVALTNTRLQHNMRKYQKQMQSIERTARMRQQCRVPGPVPDTFGDIYNAKMEGLKMENVQKKLEKNRRRVERMEKLGRLTGTMLNSVMGSANTLTRKSAYSAMTGNVSGISRDALANEVINTSADNSYSM